MAGSDFIKTSTGKESTNATLEVSLVMRVPSASIWNASATQRNYYGTTMLASAYTLNVTVQADPVSLIGMPNIQSLPTEYWTRPIEGQNT
jgi:hypothetical protein